MRLIRQLFQTYIFVPWTFFIGEPLTQLPTINKTNVNFNSLSGGKRTNNRYRRSGSANQLITFKTLFIKATCWDTGLSITRPLCALSSDPLNTSVNSWTILIGKPLPNYLLLTSVTCNRHSRWQSTNNFNSVGTDSRPTFNRVFNSQTWQRTPPNLSTEPDNSIISGWRATPNIQPDDLVPVKEVTTRPIHWPIAVITNIHPHQMASCVWYT